MTVIKALADENRVRALLALRSHELCVFQVTELLGLAPSTVSKHTSILKQARLVDSRKNGHWIYYLLADNDVPRTADGHETEAMTVLVATVRAPSRVSDYGLARSIIE